METSSISPQSKLQLHEGDTFIPQVSQSQTLFAPDLPGRILVLAQQANIRKPTSTPEAEAGGTR